MDQGVKNRGFLLLNTGPETMLRFCVAYAGQNASKSFLIMFLKRGSKAWKILRNILRSTLRNF